MLGEEDQALAYLKTAEKKTKEISHTGSILEIFEQMIAIYQAKNDQINVKKTAEKMLKVNQHYPNALYLLTKPKMETALSMLKSRGDREFALRLIGDVVQEVEEIKKAYIVYRGNITPDERIANYQADLLQADALRLLGKVKKAIALYEKVNKKYPHPSIQKQIEKLRHL